MITRREGLAVLAAGLLVPFQPAVAEEAERLFYYQLYSEGTKLSERALALNGRLVEIVGFMAPPLKAEVPFFVLTDVPMETCPFCEEIAQWPDNIIYVTSEDTLPITPYNRQIRVRGILDLGEETDPTTGFVSLVRLEKAAIV